VKVAVAAFLLAEWNVNIYHKKALKISELKFI
jgi:hypothetical protein